jgi:starch phosphorylase
MKAGINGILSLSILDGWFDEAYQWSGGWAIGGTEAYSEDQDEYHATAIYSLLENEVVPMYYSGREDGAPYEWVKRMKQCLLHISPQFNSQRMLGEYMSELYEPAHARYAALRKNSFADARSLSGWIGKVRQAWPAVRFVEMGDGPGPAITSGQKVPMRTLVDLAGLSPSDVRVEAVVGRVGVTGELEDTECFALPAVEQRGTVYVFEREFRPGQTGRLGYAMRVSPNHDENPLTRPCSSLLRWG